MQQRAVETRNAILDAALETFSEKGLGGARVDDIATKSGANKERIYANFKNKDGLFRACLQHVFERVKQRDPAWMSLHPEDYVKLPEILLRDFFTLHRTYPEFWRMLAWENLDGGKHADVLNEIHGQTYAPVRAIYTNGQYTGYFKSEVTFESFLFTLFALSTFYVANQKTLAYTLAANFFKPGEEEALIKQCLQMLGLSHD